MPNPEQIPVVGSFIRAATPADRYDIPILGDVWEAVNAVTDFVEYGCYPKWTVWVDTLWPALGEAVIQVLSFGVGDVLRGYFRPTNLRGVGALTRGARRSSKGKAGKAGRLRRFAKPPEIGDAIGKRLPGAEMVKGRKVTGLERRVWIIDTQAQRLLWYWLVADISQNFVTNWTTAIMESEACRNIGSGHCAATRTAPQVMFPDTWSQFIFWTVTDNEPDNFFQSGNGMLVIPEGKTATITYWASSGALLGSFSDGCQLRLGNSDDSDPTNITTIWPVDPTDDPNHAAITASFTGPRAVQALIKCLGTGGQFGYGAALTATY